MTSLFWAPILESGLVRSSLFLWTRHRWRHSQRCTQGHQSVSWWAKTVVPPSGCCLWPRWASHRCWCGWDWWHSYRCGAPSFARGCHLSAFWTLAFALSGWFGRHFVVPLAARQCWLEEVGWPADHLGWLVASCSFGRSCFDCSLLGISCSRSVEVIDQRYLLVVFAQLVILICLILIFVFDYSIYYFYFLN